MENKMKSSIACLILALTALLVLPPRVDAVIVHEGGPGNESAPDNPDNDPGWEYVGVLDGDLLDGTGIYIGSQWVMTAAHVGPGNITLDSGTFSAVEGTTQRLLNSDSSETDIILFRIDGDPELPNLQISEQTPAVGSDLIMIGAGRDREAEVTRWDSDWNEDPDGDIHGYRWTSERTMRWGENTLAEGGVFEVDGAMGTVESFATFFNADEGSAQATSGDSGGAVFHFNGNNGQWELAGMIHAFEQLNGQPENTSIFIFDDDIPENDPTAGNQTLSADLSQYRDQINTVVPEPSTVGVLSGLAVFGVILLARRRQS